MGSGGGGSSGAVSLPEYQQTLHAYALNDYSGGTPTVDFTKHITTNINAAMDNSPFSASAYNPDTRTGNMATAASTFKSAADALAYGTDFPLFFTAAAGELSGLRHLTESVAALGELDSLVDGVTPTTDWEGALASVVAKIVSTVVPQLHLSSAQTELGYLDTLLDTIVHTTDVKSMISNAATQIDTSVAPGSYFTAQAAAAASIIGDDIDNNITPAFQAGMRDLNAVMSSSFVIGLAHINSRKTDQLAKLTAELQTAAYMKRTDIITQAVVEMCKLYIGQLGGRSDQAKTGVALYLGHDKNLIDAITAGAAEQIKLQLGQLSAKVDSAKLAALIYGQQDDSYIKELLATVEMVYRYHLQQVDFKKVAAQLTADVNRLALVAEKEEVDVNRDIDVADAKWNLELWAYLGNLLASVQGAVVQTSPGKGTASSVIGGGLMGAAGGAGILAAWPAAAAIPGGAPAVLAAGALLGIGASLL